VGIADFTRRNQVRKKGLIRLQGLVFFTGVKIAGSGRNKVQYIPTIVQLSVFDFCLGGIKGA